MGSRLNSLIGLICLINLGCSHQVDKLRVADIFTDHMVLQQEADVIIWGWAKPQY